MYLSRLVVTALTAGTLSAPLAAQGIPRGSRTSPQAAANAPRLMVANPFAFASADSATAVRSFLPAGGPPSVLTANATNPTSTSAGVFAGQVLALTLNTQVLSSGSSLLSYVITTGPATGKTVAQVLADANKAIGGCGLPSYVTSISQLNDVVDYINNLFD